MKTQLLNYLLEASVCLAVFYMLYHIVLRKETFFVYNRIFILLVLLLSLLIPVIEIPLSQQAMYVSQQAAIDRYLVQIPLEEEQIIPAMNQEKEAGAIGVWELVCYSYLSVALLFMARFIFQVELLCSMVRKGSKKMEEYTLIATAGKLPTFSFFHWLFWDDTQTLSARDQNLILQHELVHIRQKHSWDNLLMEILKIIFWFHPCIYLFKNALQEIHEYLADQAVVETYGNRDYTQLLARQHLNKLYFSFTHPFNQSQISKRIAMIQCAQKSAKPALWKLAFALPLIGILVVTYSCKISEGTELKPQISGNQDEVLRLNEVVVVGYVNTSPEVRKIQLNETITGYGTSKKKSNAQVYDRATVMPEPVTGMSNFQHYIRKNIPSQFQKTGIHGTVWVQFIVQTDGSLSELSVIKSRDARYDTEAIRLIKEGPAWKPGKENGQAVAVRKVVPVAFGTQVSEELFKQTPLLSDKPVESQPAPEEGLEAFYKKIGKTVKYPAVARQDMAEGQVWVQFTVNPDGSLSQIEVAESLHPELDKEVLRVVSEAGIIWKPAILNGKAQPTRLLLPVSFKLGA